MKEILTCRLCCFNSLNLIPIFFHYQTITTNIIEKIKYLNLNIYQNDGLPQKICIKCYRKINIFHKFILECQKSQKILETHFQRVSFLNKTYDSLTKITTVDQTTRDFEKQFNNGAETLMYFGDENCENVFNTNLLVISQENNDGDGGTKSIIEDEDNNKFHEDNLGFENYFKDDGHSLDIENQQLLLDSMVHDITNNSSHDCITITVNSELMEKQHSHMITEKIQNTDSFISTDGTISQANVISLELPQHNSSSCIVITKDSQLNKISPEEVSFSNLFSIPSENSTTYSSKDSTKIYSDNLLTEITSSTNLSSDALSYQEIQAKYMRADDSSNQLLIGTTNQNLLDHLITSLPKDPYFSCFVCKKKFTSENNRNQHVLSFCKGGRSKENDTVKEMSYLKDINKLDLIEKENIRKNIKNRFLCELCGKKLKDATLYKSHLNRHNGINPFMCGICGKGFTARLLLSAHIKRHLESNSYRCKFCDKAFCKKLSLKNHLNNNHSDNPEIKTNHHPYKCPFCPKSFTLLCTLTEHGKTHSKPMISKHNCECGATFKRADHLKVHINSVHLKKKPYDCEKCGKKFETAWLRNAHFKMFHLGIKHYCSICNKEFSLITSRKRHEKTVHGNNLESRFCCEFCGNSFKHRSNLEKHLNNDHQLDENTKKEIEERIYDKIKITSLSECNNRPKRRKKSKK